MAREGIPVQIDKFNELAEIKRFVTHYKAQGPTTHLYFTTDSGTKIRDEGSRQALVNSIEVSWDIWELVAPSGQMADSLHATVQLSITSDKEHSLFNILFSFF